MNFPSFDQWVPFLSDRGKVEVDLALAKWQVQDLTARHEAISAELVAAQAENIETPD